MKPQTFIQSLLMAVAAQLPWPFYTRKVHVERIRIENVHEPPSPFLCLLLSPKKHQTATHSVPQFLYSCLVKYASESTAGNTISNVRTHMHKWGIYVGVVAMDGKRWIIWIKRQTIKKWTLFPKNSRCWPCCCRCCSIQVRPNICFDIYDMPLLLFAPPSTRSPRIWQGQFTRHEYIVVVLLIHLMVSKVPTCWTGARGKV